MPQSKELYGLTIFRFVAAFYVFVFHCNLRYPVELPSWVSKIIQNGAVGMTFFFILSGFVLSWASRGGIKEKYMLSRAARIYPAYLLMGLISLPFIFEYNPVKIITYLLIFLTNTQSWLPSLFSQWNFGGSWSVSTELFFYISFPLIFPIIKKNPLTTLIISFVITSSIIPLSLIINDSVNFPNYYVSPIHRLPEFTIGVALGCLYSSGHKLPKFKNILFALSILGLMFISPNNNDGWMRNNYVTVFSTGYVVYYLASTSLKPGLLTLPFIYLGKISYSFYLMQLPIMLFIIKYHNLLAPLPHWMIWVLLALINIIMASVCYHSVENNKAIKAIFMRQKNSNNKLRV